MLKDAVTNPKLVKDARGDKYTVEQIMELYHKVDGPDSSAPALFEIRRILGQPDERDEHRYAKAFRKLTIGEKAKLVVSPANVAEWAATYALPWDHPTRRKALKADEKPRKTRHASVMGGAVCVALAGAGHVFTAVGIVDKWNASTQTGNALASKPARDVAKGKKRKDRYRYLSFRL